MFYKTHPKSASICLKKYLKFGLFTAALKSASVTRSDGNGILTR